MGDALLHTGHRQEALSRAYIQAVAAGAGYVVSTMDFDMDGIDVEIKAGGAMRPAIGIQLKATINLSETSDGLYGFDLKKHNYDLLRGATQVPRVLVVLHLPRDESSWLTVTPEHLMMRKCAFWLSLAHHKESDNETSVRVYLDPAKRLDVDSLRDLMDQSRKGAIR